MKKNIISKHNNMNRKHLTEYEQINNKKYSFRLQQVIDYNDEEVIITAAIKMNLNDPKCKKILKKLENKQESPLTLYLNKLERETRHDIKYEENGIIPTYILPDELAEKI